MNRSGRNPEYEALSVTICNCEICKFHREKQRITIKDVNLVATTNTNNIKRIDINAIDYLEI